MPNRNAKYAPMNAVCAIEDKEAQLATGKAGDLRAGDAGQHGGQWTVGVPDQNGVQELHQIPTSHG